jgi:release factor glutamine methyltransferase
MTSLRPVIDAATVALAEAGVGSPRTDAELLAAHAAGTERGRLVLVDASPELLDRYDQLVGRRASREPLQHLIGTAAFGPVTVHVGPGVFIPRPETESLLEWAVFQHLPSRPVIVDLCTGSGALALALSKNSPDARVIAVDDSDEALCYARRRHACRTCQSRRHPARSASRTRRPGGSRCRQSALHPGWDNTGTRSGRT